MASQLCHNFQASQTVLGADDDTIPNFSSPINSISICGPQLIISFATELWSAQPYSINLTGPRPKLKMVLGLFFERGIMFLRYLA